MIEAKLTVANVPRDQPCYSELSLAGCVAERKQLGVSQNYH